MNAEENDVELSPEVAREIADRALPYSREGVWPKSIAAFAVECARFAVAAERARIDAALRACTVRILEKDGQGDRLGLRCSDVWQALK